LANTARLKAFRALLRSPLTAADTKAAQAEALGASDRASALMHAALMDAILKDTLRRRMTALSAAESDDLFRGQGPLASFSAKIKVSYALRFFGKKTGDDLHLIREIRNGFAHHTGALTFATSELAALCAVLYHPDHTLLALPSSGSTTGRRQPMGFNAVGDRTSPRKRFEIGCSLIGTNIQTFGRYRWSAANRRLYLP
jgi:hypothetical protein